MQQPWRVKAVMGALCLAPASLLVACGSNEHGAPRRPAEVSVVAGVSLVANIDPAWSEGDTWQLAPEATLIIGVDEGLEGAMLTDAYSVAPLSDGTILVVDGGSKELRFFAADGAYVRSAGGPGQGPCEFSAIGPAYPAEDGTIIVGDWRSRRYSLFAVDGRCVANQTLQFPEYRYSQIVGRLTSGEVILFASNLERPDASSSLRVRWQTTDLARLATGADSPTRLVQVPHSEWNGQLENLEFASFASAVTHHDLIFYTDGDTYEITVFDRDGSALRRMSRSQLPEPLTPDDIEVWKDAAEAWQLKYGRAVDAREIVEGKAFAERIPAYERLLVDADGNVWALRSDGLAGRLRSLASFGPSGPSGPDTFFNDGEPPATRLWDVYEEGGLWLGTVHIRSDREPSYIGTDRVFLTGLDALGVHRVWIHKITKPR